MEQMECESASEKEPALPDSTGESDKEKKLEKQRTGCQSLGENIKKALKFLE